MEDLAVIDEEVHLRPVVLDVPGEDLRVGGLEHDFFEAQGVHDLGRDVGPPGLHVLRDPFRLDHGRVGSGIDKALSLKDGPAGIAGPFGLELGRHRGTPGPVGKVRLKQMFIIPIVLIHIPCSPIAFLFQYALAPDLNIFTSRPFSFFVFALFSGGPQVHR